MQVRVLSPTPRNMFLFKKQKIVVDAFTFISTAHEFFPIRPAIYSLPDWWKNLPSTLDNKVSENINIKTGTMKNCAGFKSMYKDSFMLNMWSDLVICIPEGKTNVDIIFANSPLNLVNSPEYSMHDSNQYGNNFQEYLHIKLMSPWIIEQKADLNWMWSEPTWNMLEHNPEVKVLPGVIEFRDQHALNINLMLKKSGTLFETMAGEPIVQLTPITEREVEVRNHLISKEEWIQRADSTNPQLKFAGGYKFIKTARKIREKAQKCPFH